MDLTEHEVAFGRWRLLRRSRLLLRDDAPVPIRSRAFDLLLALVEAGGALVTKNDLLDRVWPGVIVEENNLQAQMSALRKALGPDAPTLIATIPGRGYRFIGALQPGDAAVEPQAQHPEASNPVEARPGAAAFRRDAVVVHPFTSPAALAELAAALTSDVAAELARFEDLRVLLAAERDEPGAYRVSGEVRPYAEQVRISVRLAGADGAGTIWSDRLDRPAADPPGWRDALTASLSNQVDLQINRASLGRARETAPEARSARDLCLLGRELHQRGNRADTGAAQELFERAASLDPGGAPGWAWFAFTVMRAVTHGWLEGDDTPERVRSLQLAHRALELEPASPLCLCATGFALALNDNWSEAAEMARAALRAGRPADYGTRTSCGEVLAAAGYAGEAIEAARRAMELDPHCPPRARAVLGRAFLLDGQLDEALRELRWCTAMLPDYAPAFRTLVVAAVEAGNLPEARGALREVARLQPNWLNPGSFWFLRHGADLGRFRQAFRIAGIGQVAAQAS